VENSWYSQRPFFLEDRSTAQSIHPRCQVGDKPAKLSPCTSLNCDTTFGQARSWYFRICQ
jgi:hypothetical protein